MNTDHTTTSTATSEPVELAPIWVTRRDGHRTPVLGEPTQTPQLWITPRVDVRDGRWAGSWSLTHEPTGLYLITSDRPSFLRDVAAALHGLDWAFTSRATAPAATEQAAKRVLAYALADAYRYDEDSGEPLTPDPFEVEQAARAVVDAWDEGRFQAGPTGDALLRDLHTALAAVDARYGSGGDAA